jgi:pimeloyl-ACP methyl ester carboxylesterase
MGDRFLRRLSSLGRLIHFDRRGTGLSDPVPLDQPPDLQTQVGDAVAVLKAAGSEGAAVIGLNDGTIVATLLAAAHPELCRSLVLFTLTARHTLAAGQPLESVDEVIEMIEADAVNDRSGMELLAPSRLGDDGFDRQLARLQRFSVRPGAYGHYYRQTMEADMAGVLPSIRTPPWCSTAPATGSSRSSSPAWPRRRSRARGSSSSPGTDHLAFSEGIDGLLDEVEEFLTGTRTGADPDRKLTTLLFTDIVNSTTLAARMGDRRWRDVLDQHYELGRRELARFAGREVVTTGDGFFASFDRPLAAVRCAPRHDRGDGLAGSPAPRRRPHRRGRGARRRPRRAGRPHRGPGRRARRHRRGAGLEHRQGPARRLRRRRRGPG